MAGNRLPIVVADLPCAAILKCRPKPEGPPPRGSKRLCVSSRAIARRQLWPFRTECRRKREVDMFKSKAPEKDQSTTANLEEVVARTVQPQHSVVEHPTGREPMTKPGTGSCIGSGMSIVGNIECNGPAQVFGQVKGEVRASDLLIGDGAQIEGSVIAQDVTVCGRVKGTIRAVRVKLQDGGAVEGDIFHRSLMIEENSVFEGSSRRVENPTDAAPIDAKGPRDEDARSSALAPYLQRVEPSASTELSESTVEPKH